MNPFLAVVFGLAVVLLLVMLIGIYVAPHMFVPIEPDSTPVAGMADEQAPQEGDEHVQL